MKYLIGSTLLGLKNSKDTDYIEIVTSVQQPQVFDKASNTDTFYTTIDELNDLLNFRKEINMKTAFIYHTLFQYDRNIIGKEFPIEYHFLDHRDEWVYFLKYCLNNHLYNLNRHVLSKIKVGGNTTGEKVLPKRIYLTMYMIFILENNSITLTEEQKAIVQKIHDKQMPIDYFDTIEEKIRNL